MSKETSVELNRTAIASESVSSLPADLTSERSENALKLLSWLGSFWTAVYKDPDFIEYLEDARALRIAQLYLDLLENLKLEDRENIPVFHRERWHPIVIRRSQAGTGSKEMFKLVDRKVDKSGILLGDDQKDDVYPNPTLFTLGGEKVDLNDMVVYPLSGGSDVLKTVLTCICNNIANASVVLGKGSDFVILPGAIAISKKCDPFIGETADEFPKFEVLHDNPEDNDEETVLWACDTLFDRDFVYKSIGYVMSLPTASTELYKRLVNAAWNTVASGCTPLLLKSLMATICGIPTVKSDGEIVEEIVDNDDSLQVITSKNVYTFPVNVELKDDVRVGAELRRFDTLDKAVRIYPCITDVDGIGMYNEFVSSMDEFASDVPYVDLPPAFFRPELDSGFSVGWAEVPVYCVGFDKNGNPKLRFDMEGSDFDNDMFWDDVWASYEEAGESMASLLDCVNDDTIFEAGREVGSISPIKFFLRNLVGANMLIMTVRTDTLADDAPLYDPKFFGVVRDCVPSYIRLYVIEHETVSENPDSPASTISADDSADLYAYEEFDDEVEYNSRGRRPKVRDRVDSKWVAACRDEYDD